MKKTQSEQYCQDLLLLDIYRCKATANAVISLSSCRDAKHFVDTTLSPLYHHQYSSLTASVSLMTTKWGQVITERQVRKLLYKYIGKKSEDERYYVLQTDTTGMKRLYSPKLAGRKVIYNSQNKILSNKPISIGHEVSYVNLSKEDGPPLRLEYSLDSSIKECQADELVIIDSQIGRNNRAIKIEISRFNDVMVRSKKGFSMKDKPFDLIAITVKDALSGERIFQKDCFLALSGERKSEILIIETHPQRRTACLSKKVWYRNIFWV